MSCPDHCPEYCTSCGEEDLSPWAVRVVLYPTTVPEGCVEKSVRYPFGVTCWATCPYRFVVRFTSRGRAIVRTPDEANPWRCVSAGSTCTVAA